MIDLRFRAFHNFRAEEERVNQYLYVSSPPDYEFESVIAQGMKVLKV